MKYLHKMKYLEVFFFVTIGRVIIKQL